jgi:hypothetical protein
MDNKQKPSNALCYTPSSESFFFFQWLVQPIQGPGLLFSIVTIFHRRYDSLDEWSARRKAAT